MAMKSRYTVIDGEIVAEKRNGAYHSYVPDPLGSTVALLDNTQTQVNTFTYWPYGEVNTSTGTNPPPFKFVGTLGYYTDNSGKINVRARVLDPPIGRWLTVDRIGRHIANRAQYTYVGLNPMLAADPSGMAPPQPTPIVGDPDYPKWHKCMSQGVKKHCNSNTGAAYAYLWCIIDGESQWVRPPKDYTPITSGPYKGQHACGLTQIVGAANGDTCRQRGYSAWKDDNGNCDNIKCGASLMCDCLNSNGGNIKGCAGTYNSINQPPGRFKLCLQNKFNIAI